MADQKKFLDYEGVKHLWSKVNMQDYPNNETLMAVINAIDETKADKNELVTELSFNNIYFTYDSTKDNYAYIYGFDTSRGYTDFVFYIGDRYKVIFDGVEYDNLICSCWDDEYIGIGSSWYDSDNPAYPFGFVTPNVNNINRERRLDCYNMSDGDHTFSIYHYVKILPQALVDKREYITDFIMWDEGDLYHTEDLNCDHWESDIPYYVSINNEPFQIIYYLNENNDRNFSPYYHQDGRKTILRSNAYKNGNLHIWGESYSNYTESPVITFGRIIKKIDSIYIPDTIARVDDIPDIESQVFIVTYDSVNDYEDLGEAIYNASREGKVVVFQSGDNFYDLAYSEIEPSHAASFVQAQWDGHISSIQVNYSEITREDFDTKNYVDTAIANLVDSAPETLNTLNELATAFQENQDLTTTLNQAIEEKATLEDLNNHKNNIEIHITAAEREKWNKEQVQVDWNQNNNTAVDYVKNRTHYIENTSVEINETLIPNGNGYYIQYGGAIYRGESYLISINDGPLLDCNWEEVVEGEYPTDIIAYRAMYKAQYQNQVIYYFSYSETNNAGFFMKANSTPQLTILNVTSSTFHPLNEKFIPDTIARTNEIPSIEGLATEEYVNNKVAELSDIDWNDLKNNLNQSINNPWYYPIDASKIQIYYQGSLFCTFVRTNLSSVRGTSYWNYSGNCNNTSIRNTLYGENFDFNDEENQAQVFFSANFDRLYYDANGERMTDIENNLIAKKNQSVTWLFGHLADMDENHVWNVINYFPITCNDCGKDNVALAMDMAHKYIAGLSNEPTNQSLKLTDTVTGIEYMIAVTNGKLTMQEV